MEIFIHSQKPTSQAHIIFWISTSFKERINKFIRSERYAINATSDYVTWSWCRFVIGSKNHKLGLPLVHYIRFDFCYVNPPDLMLCACISWSTELNFNPLDIYIVCVPKGVGIRQRSPEA